MIFICIFLYIYIKKKLLPLQIATNVYEQIKIILNLNVKMNGLNYL